MCSLHFQRAIALAFGRQLSFPSVPLLQSAQCACGAIGDPMTTLSQQYPRYKRPLSETPDGVFDLALCLAEATSTPTCV